MEVSWAELSQSRKDLADGGYELLYQFGVGLAFLATVRADGGPRMHPMCPIIHDDGLFAFLIPSPKRSDLLRDGRYSMHSFPADGNEDAFSISGRAGEVASEVRRGLEARFLREREGNQASAHGLDDQMAFEFRIETVLLTRTNGHGDPEPAHTLWHA